MLEVAADIHTAHPGPAQTREYCEDRPQTPTGVLTSILTPTANPAIRQNVNAAVDAPLESLYDEFAACSWYVANMQEYQVGTEAEFTSRVGTAAPFYTEEDMRQLIQECLTIARRLTTRQAP